RATRAAVIGAIAAGVSFGSAAIALPTPAPATTSSSRLGPVPHVPIHASRLGIATGAVFWSESPTAREHELADLQHLGVRYVRTVFPWDAIERTQPGSYQWATADAIVAATRAHHLLLIAQV